MKNDPTLTDIAKVIDEKLDEHGAKLDSLTKTVDGLTKTVNNLTDTVNQNGAKLDTVYNWCEGMKKTQREHAVKLHEQAENMLHFNAPALIR